METNCPKCGYPIKLIDSMKRIVGESEVFTVKDEGGVMSLDEPTGKKWQWVEWHVHCPFCGKNFKC